MIKLLTKEGTRELKIREYAMLRDGSIIIKVSDATGNVKWVDARELEVVRI